MLDTILETEVDLARREREAYLRWKDAVRFKEHASSHLAEYRRLHSLRLRLVREAAGSRMGR